jgi:hypothetical protein
VVFDLLYKSKFLCSVISALKCLYWLVKEEVAHHTKFGSLLELAKSIGCPYLSELDVSKGANYRSYIMMIDDFLTVLSDCVETTVLSDVHNSSYCWHSLL